LVSPIDGSWTIHIEGYATSGECWEVDGTGDVVGARGVVAADEARENWSVAGLCRAQPAGYSIDKA
jgi:hypothetical protein